MSDVGYSNNGDKEPNSDHELDREDDEPEADMSEV
jgi:hypothetical protein